MNYEQIKRLKIEDHKDMEMFIASLKSNHQAIIDDGPANFVANWIDAIHSGEDELSFKTWILTLSKIKNYFDEYPKGVEIKNFKRMYAYIASLKYLIKKLGIITIPFMHNTRKWQSILFVEFNAIEKVVYYAINEFLINELKDTGVQLMGFEQFLANESTNVKIGAEGYSQFIKELFKENTK